MVDTLTLWAAFCRLGEQDPPTTAAVPDRLAMAGRYPQVARYFMVNGVAGCEALVCALLSVDPDIPNANDLILRAVVATSSLAEDASIRPLLLLGGVADALKEPLLVVRGAEVMAAARAADACDDALKLLHQELDQVQALRAEQEAGETPRDKPTSTGDRFDSSKLE